MVNKDFKKCAYFAVDGFYAVSASRGHYYVCVLCMYFSILVFLVC